MDKYMNIFMDRWMDMHSDKDNGWVWIMHLDLHRGLAGVQPTSQTWPFKSHEPRMVFTYLKDCKSKHVNKEYVTHGPQSV